MLLMVNIAYNADVRKMTLPLLGLVAFRREPKPMAFPILR